MQFFFKYLKSYSFQAAHPSPQYGQINKKSLEKILISNRTVFTISYSK